MGLELPPKSKETKIVSGISCVSFDIEIPAHANINPSDIKVHFKKGWSKLDTPKKTKRKPRQKMAINNQEKKTTGGVFD